MKKLKNLLLSLLSVIFLGSAALGFAGCNLLLVDTASQESAQSPSSEYNSESPDNSENQENSSSGDSPNESETETLAFELSDDGTYYIVSGIGSYTASDLIIPSSYKTLPVKEIANKAFFENSSLTSVTIPDSVITIGESVFEGCSGLVDLTLGNSVQTIGNKAFYLCIHITIIVIPESVTVMGSEVFGECEDLYVLTSWTEQPEGWTSDWFDADDNETNIFYDEMHWEINEGAIFVYGDWYTFQAPTCEQDGEERRNCLNVDGYYQTRPTPAQHALTSYTGQAATCTKSGWEDYEVCQNCSYSTFRTIRATGHHYENDTCTVCKQGYSEGLTYTLSSDETYYIVSASNSFTSDELSIPPTYNRLPVKEIMSYGFQNKKTITYATIPDSITVINQFAFLNCSALTDISLPESVASIGSYAFQNCSALTSIIIPEPVTSIGKCAFYKCTALTDIQYNAIECADFTSNQNDAFYDAGLNGNGITVTIGANVKKIPAYIFYASQSHEPKIASVIFEKESACQYIGTTAFRSVGSLTEISLPNGLLKIDAYAFSNCEGLTSITIPDSVTTIGECAFMLCSGAKSITIGKNVTSIGNSAFSGCLAVTDLRYNATDLSPLTSTYNNCIFNTLGLNGNGISLTIGKNVKQIPAYLFDTLTTRAALTTLTFEEGSVCETINKNAFRGVTTLKNVYLPDSLLKIEADAFSSCSALETLILPDSVTTLGSYVFGNCKALKSLTIGKGISTLGDSAFDGCTALTTIYYNATQCQDLSSSNYVFAWVGQEGDGITLTISKDVKKLPAYLFAPYSSAEKYAPYVTKLIFEKDFAVESFGYGVFDNCLYIKEIYYDGAITIGSNSLLTQSVGKNAESVTATIGKHVKTIPDGFFQPISLTSIIFEEESICENIGSSAFSSCKITELTIPNSVKSIGTYAFQLCSSLTSLSIPDSVTYLGESAFLSCSSLTNVVIGSGLTSIERATFYGCSKLTDITFGSNITSIGFSAFYYSNDITNVYYTGTITDWCNISFSAGESNPLYKATNFYIGEKLITELILPDSVTEIKNYAFYQFTGLTSVTLGENVTSIGANAFYKCENLKEIVISKKLTSVGDSAFYWCNIECVYYKGTQEDWKKITFGSYSSFLTNATRYYFSENEPTDPGNYWRYNDNGEIVICSSNEK